MSGQNGQSRRVILVGRTGLDAKLRLDPELELLRVRNPIEAIAELADPIDDQSPAKAVVVFGEGGTPGVGERADEVMEDAVRGLRLVDPQVSIMATTPVPAALAGAVDALLDASRSSDELREQIRAGATPSPAPAIAAKAAAPEKPAADPAPAASIVPDEADESDPATALAHGRDPVALLLKNLSKVLSDETIRLERGHVPNGAAVVWGGSVIGTLMSGKLRPEQLAPHTALLAPWVAIREQMRRLRLAAYSDPLTGAWNRRYFDQFLSAAIQIAQDNRHSVTVLVFDIDDFKNFNDRWGHEAGDDILRETVRLLRSVIRPTDRVCRIGGDEFAVIFNEPEGPRVAASRHPKTIYQIAARFQEQVRAAKFPKLTAEAPATLRISGGLATYPWDGLTAQELVCRADERALDGKRQGKNVIMLGPGAEEQ